MRDNTLSIWDYEITFDVWKAGHFTFTDATGDVYTKNCFFAGHDHRSMSIAFNSDDPRLVSVASSEKGPDAEPEPEPEPEPAPESEPESEPEPEPPRLEPAETQPEPESHKPAADTGMSPEMRRAVAMRRKFTQLREDMHDVPEDGEELTDASEPQGELGSPPAAPAPKPAAQPSDEVTDGVVSEAEKASAASLWGLLRSSAAIVVPAHEKKDATALEVTVLCMCCTAGKH